MYYTLTHVIIAQDAGDLEFILKRLNKVYKEWVLPINFNKTEFIAINTDQKFHINIEENLTISKFRTSIISSRSILILSSHLRLGLPKDLFPVGLPAEILKTLLPSSIYLPCPSQSSRFNHPDYIR